MSANGISSLSTKEDKQRAKLNLAALKRQGYTLNSDGSVASGPDVTKEFYRARNQYDITELPTEYSGNNIVDNPNEGGLVVGRPWISGGMVDGLIWRRVYDGIFENDSSTFDRLISEGPVDTIIDENIPTNITYEYLGYFRANWTGTWTFLVQADDAAFFWIGPNARAGGNGGNRDLAQIAINSVGSGYIDVDLVDGNVYPFRLVCGNGGGPGYIRFQWYNNLTTSRLLSLDAAVDDPGFGNTDDDNFPGYGQLIGSGVTRSTAHGGVIVFDGTELSGTGRGYVQLSEPFYSDFSGGITISIWANVATGANIWGRLIDFGNGQQNDNFLIAVFGSNPNEFAMQVFDGSGLGTNLIVLGDIHFDQWKLYTLTGTGSGYYWYVNDQLANDLSGLSFLPNNVARNGWNCRIGGSNWDTQNDWNLKGSIASVEIYNRALTQDEITGLFNERRGRFGI